MIFGTPDRTLFECCLGDARELGCAGSFSGIYLHSKVSNVMVYRSESIPERALPHFGLHLGWIPEDPIDGVFAGSKRWIVAISGKCDYVGQAPGPEIGGDIVNWALENSQDKIPLAGHSEILALQSTFNKLQGKFTAWLYHLPSKQVFIYRTGAPLYYNAEHHLFYSIKSDGDFLLKPNVVYKFKERSIEPLLRITPKKSSSPDLP